ncbi:MAG TPA: hypothetical protein PKM34_04465 [Bacteroidales bacterium]|nr:hypothetical protein [Bacteroidales bacterium]
MLLLVRGAHLAAKPCVALGHHRVAEADDEHAQLEQPPAHGDGLGPGDNGYKFLKKVFSCRFNQYLFRWLHPDIGARMGLYFSGKSRLANMIKEDKAENLNRIEDEMLYQYATGILQNGTKPDYFIFGHRHRPENIELPGGSRLIILGDWLTHFTYAEFDGKQIHLKKFKS